MTIPPESLPAATLQHTIRIKAGAVHLDVDFQRVNDRFSHTVRFVWQVGDKSHCQTLLDSQEGDAAQLWPDSPPIQACQAEEDLRILGTGMAGKAHWSLALSHLENSQDVLVWDVACRLKEAAQELGSSYCCEQVPEATTGGCRWSLPGGYQCQLSVGTDAATKSDLLIDGHQIQIRPAQVAAPPATVRWLYTIELQAT